MMVILSKSFRLLTSGGKLTFCFIHEIISLRTERVVCEVADIKKQRVVFKLEIGAKETYELLKTQQKLPVIEHTLRPKTSETVK
jgi:hypothetical protein